MHLTEHTIFLNAQNPWIHASEFHKFRWSVDFEALKLSNARSGDEWNRLIYLSDVSDDLIRGRVPHGVVEPGHPDPEAVEAVVRAVDGQDGSARVGLGHATVPLQDHNLGPDLVVDRLPFVLNLLDVVL